MTVRNGDIGRTIKRIELEPLPGTAPAEAPAAPEPAAVPAPEPVPA